MQLGLKIIECDGEKIEVDQKKLYYCFKEWFEYCDSIGANYLYNITDEELKTIENKDRLYMSYVQATNLVDKGLISNKGLEKIINDLENSTKVNKNNAKQRSKSLPPKTS